MLYCKSCDSIIVPGRAYLTSRGYFCPHCIEDARSRRKDPVFVGRHQGEEGSGAHGKM